MSTHALPETSDYLWINSMLMLSLYTEVPCSISSPLSKNKPSEKWIRACTHFAAAKCQVMKGKHFVASCVAVGSRIELQTHQKVSVGWLHLPGTGQKNSKIIQVRPHHGNMLHHP
jgi:hypothetical protein